MVAPTVALDVVNEVITNFADTFAETRAADDRAWIGICNSSSDLTAGDGSGNWDGEAFDVHGRLSAAARLMVARFSIADLSNVTVGSSTVTVNGMASGPGQAMDTYLISHPTQEVLTRTLYTAVGESQADEDISVTVTGPAIAVCFVFGRSFVNSLIDWSGGYDGSFTELLRTDLRHPRVTDAQTIPEAGTYVFRKEHNAGANWSNAYIFTFEADAEASGGVAPSVRRMRHKRRLYEGTM